MPPTSLAIPGDFGRLRWNGMGRASRRQQESILFQLLARNNVSTAISLPTLCGDMDAFQRQIHVHVEIDNDEDRHRWCEATSNAFKQLKSSVSNRRREIHALVFREVARREPAKYLDIQRLKQTDALIREYLDVVQAHLASFAATEVTEQDVTEQDEAQMQLDELKLVADQLLASLREQEEAVIETFAESINE